MKKRDIALYKLADAAVSGNSRFPSLDAATEYVSASLSRSTVGRVVQDMCDVGAARWTDGSGELVLCSPSRAVDMYKTTWTRKREQVGRVSLSAAQELVCNGEAVWGGFPAAAHYLGGAPASPHPHSIYVSANSFVVNRNGDVPIYRWVDNNLPVSGFSTVTQTLTELFNTPGWMSGDFCAALWNKYLERAR